MDAETEQEVLQKMSQYQFKGKDLNDLVKKLKEILVYDHLLNVFYLDPTDQGQTKDIDETILYSIIRAKSHLKGEQSESKSKYTSLPSSLGDISFIDGLLSLQKYSNPSYG